MNTSFLDTQEAFIPQPRSLLSSTLLSRPGLSGFSITPMTEELVFVGLPLWSNHGPFAGVGGEEPCAGARGWGSQRGAPSCPSLSSAPLCAFAPGAARPQPSAAFCRHLALEERCEGGMDTGPGLAAGSEIAALFVRVTHPCLSELQPPRPGRSGEEAGLGGARLVPGARR